MCFLKDFDAPHIFGLRLVENEATLFELHYNKKYLVELANGIPEEKLSISRYPEQNNFLDLTNDNDVDIVLNWLYNHKILVSPNQRSTKISQIFTKSNTKKIATRSKRRYKKRLEKGIKNNEKHQKCIMK